MKRIKTWFRNFFGARSAGFTIDQQVYIKRLFDRQDLVWEMREEVQSNKIIKSLTANFKKREQAQTDKIIKDIAEIVITQNASIMRHQESQNRKLKQIENLLYEQNHRVTLLEDQDLKAI